MEWLKGLQTSLNASVNKSWVSDKSSPVGFYEIVKDFNIKESLALWNGQRYLQAYIIVKYFYELIRWLL